MTEVKNSTEQVILALNCGSSSLKFGVYGTSGAEARLLCEGEGEEIGSDHASLWLRESGKDRVEQNDRSALRDHRSTLNVVFAMLEGRTPKVQAIGHRFVHGGPALTEHVLLTPDVQRELQQAVNFAPLHLPSALAVLEAAAHKLPGVPQAICLDTAFHRTMPEASKTYPLSQDARQDGVQRYGFHGLSLESILLQLPAIPPRLIVAHLGNGASITAIRDGSSVDTTMGLTPTGGVMMGTRPGDLDPGLAVYLMRNGYGDPKELEGLFNHKSGLLGVSGLTSDVRELQAKRKENHQADLALTMFCYQVRKAIGSMAAALGGVDELVFTGGIGEHAADLRQEICASLDFLKIASIRVLPSEEDTQIARIAGRLVQKTWQ